MEGLRCWGGLKRTDVWLFQNESREVTGWLGLGLLFLSGWSCCALYWGRVLALPFLVGVVSMAAHLPPLIPPAPKGKKFLSNSIWVELLLPGSNGLERLCFLMLRHGPQLRRAAGHGCVSVCCMAPLHCFCWGSCSRGSTVSWLREIIRLKAFADLSGGGMEKGKGGLVIFRYCGSTEDLFALCTVTAWLCYQLWGGNKWGLRTRSFLALASVQGCGFF